jgi:hypothetical protein
MMELHLLDLTRSDLWQEMWHSLPTRQQQPWMSPQWYALFEQYGYGSANCFVMHDQRGVAMYPFLMNPVPKNLTAGTEEYRDIQGAPGYNGIATDCADPLFLSDFHSQFEMWCKTNLVVAEFSRCNPVNQNHQLFPAQSTVEVNRNIIVDIELFAETEKYFDRSAIKNIKKAQREGLTTAVIPGNHVNIQELEQFTDIYTDTLYRNHANNEWYYTLQFFSDTAKLMGEMALFCFTRKQNTPIAAEIVITGKDAAYSWLGGTLSDHFPERPNDMLKYGIILYLREQGVKSFCLGGGMQPGDGIFRYKKTFAPSGEVPFYIVKRIHFPNVHSRLISTWADQFPALHAKYGNRLLAYREIS